MTFDDPTLYGRDEDEEFGDSGAYSESLEEDFEEEEEEEEEPGMPESESIEPEPMPPPPPAPKPAPAGAKPADNSGLTSLITGVADMMAPGGGAPLGAGVGLRMTGKYSDGRLLLDFGGVEKAVNEETRRARNHLLPIPRLINPGNAGRWKSETIPSAFGTAGNSKRSTRTRISSIAPAGLRALSRISIRGTALSTTMNGIVSLPTTARAGAAL